MTMNQKVNKKQNETPNSLYLKLRQALNAQKHYVKLQQKKLIKKKTNTFFQNKKETPLSCSLNLNEAILQNSDHPRGLSLALNTSKLSCNIQNPLTPYQTRKSQDGIKIDILSPKKQSYFELHKKRYPQSTKILAVKQQRIQKFFKPQRPKTELAQNQESLTYSMILKSFTNSENICQSQNSLIKNTQNSQKNYSTQKCDHCSFHTQDRAAMFFKNEQIKKNISIIEQMKQAFNQKNTEAEFKHFPQVQVLNLSYFNENKKKIVNKINSRQGLTSLQKMKLFASRKKFTELQCSKCKSIQKQIQQQRKQKQISNLIKYPNSFQYFVYEYKPTGHSTKKNIRNQKVQSQSTLYVKKNKFNHKNINNHKPPSSINNFSNSFHDFIMHNKIDVPLRPQTAAPVKTHQQVLHYRISHHCPTHQYHHYIPNQIFNQENFVKPWESTAHEIDHEF